jgi:hypothetical protein
MSLIKFVKENHPLMPKFTQWVFWAVGECKVCMKYSGIFVLMPFKGTVSRDIYFFEGLNILIGTFCECDDGFQDLSKHFYCPKKLLTF